MKCDLCEKEATVHEWTKKAGHKIEKHLCEECARKQGVAIQPQQQISQLITSLMNTAPAVGPQAPAGHATPPANACPACSTTYAQFRHSGLLGCPTCYAAFEAQLGPLLQRAHEGGTHHAGKVPHTPTLQHVPRPVSPVTPAPARPAAPPPGPSSVTVIGPPVPGVPDPVAEAARLEMIKRLRAQLAEAIAAEQYERAAKVRDELCRIDPSAAKPAPPSSSPPPPPSAPSP